MNKIKRELKWMVYYAKCILYKMNALKTKPAITEDMLLKRDMPMD